MGYTVPEMKNSWIKIRCSDVDLVVLREVAELIGTDVSTAVHVMSREKWRRLNKAPALPTAPTAPSANKGRRSRA
jgi:hypothetical protein